MGQREPRLPLLQERLFRFGGGGGLVDNDIARRLIDIALDRPVVLLEGGLDRLQDPRWVPSQ